jgi:hypothetical protein
MEGDMTKRLQERIDRFLAKPPTGWLALVLALEQDRQLRAMAADLTTH